MRRCAVVLAAALISVTALGGCGSADDATSDAADDTPSSSTEGSDDASPSDDGESADDDGDSDDGTGSGQADDKDDKSDADDNKADKKDADDKSDKKDDDKADDASGDGYCAEVKSLKSDFDPSNSASLANATDMDAIVDRFEDITDAAPGKIRSDWEALTGAYKLLARQLDKYDIKLTDPKGFTKLKPKERKAIQTAIGKTQKVAGSVQAISSDIKNTCGLTLQ